ncbi:unnamed protein product [Anisakis simplex]|uniref:C2H2-type domain-containing protein n=1 Tax=Anisakis simplex TaxID=6269 RepID=A0A0M3K2F9_ANISI|nr:unnamed protein product [Anisakis simplex]
MSSDEDFSQYEGLPWDGWLAATQAHPSSHHVHISDIGFDAASMPCQTMSKVNEMRVTEAVCYGYYPSIELNSMVLVKCKHCGMLIKDVGYGHHMRSRHSFRAESPASADECQSFLLSPPHAVTSPRLSNDYPPILSPPYRKPSTSYHLSSPTDDRPVSIVSRTISPRYSVEQRDDLKLSLRVSRREIPLEIEPDPSSSSPVNDVNVRDKSLIKTSSSSPVQSASEQQQITKQLNGRIKSRKKRKRKRDSSDEEHMSLEHLRIKKRLESQRVSCTNTAPCTSSSALLMDATTSAISSPSTLVMSDKDDKSKVSPMRATATAANKRRAAAAVCVNVDSELITPPPAPPSRVQSPTSASCTVDQTHGLLSTDVVVGSNVATSRITGMTTPSSPLATIQQSNNVMTALRPSMREQQPTFPLSPSFDGLFQRYTSSSIPDAGTAATSADAVATVSMQRYHVPSASASSLSTLVLPSTQCLASSVPLSIPMATITASNSIRRIPLERLEHSSVTSPKVHMMSSPVETSTEFTHLRSPRPPSSPPQLSPIEQKAFMLSKQTSKPQPLQVNSQPNISGYTAPVASSQLYIPTTTATTPPASLIISSDYAAVTTTGCVEEDFEQDNEMRSLINGMRDINNGGPRVITNFHLDDGGVNIGEVLQPQLQSQCRSQPQPQQIKMSVAERQEINASEQASMSNLIVEMSTATSVSDDETADVAFRDESNENANRILVLKQEIVESPSSNASVIALTPEEQRSEMEVVEGEALRNGEGSEEEMDTSSVCQPPILIRQQPVVNPSAQHRLVQISCSSTLPCKRVHRSCSSPPSAGSSGMTCSSSSSARDLMSCCRHDDLKYANARIMLARALGISLNYPPPPRSSPPAIIPTNQSSKSNDIRTKMELVSPVPSETCESKVLSTSQLGAVSLSSETNPSERLSDAGTVSEHGRIRVATVNQVISTASVGVNQKATSSTVLNGSMVTNNNAAGTFRSLRADFGANVPTDAMSRDVQIFKTSNVTTSGTGLGQSMDAGMGQHGRNDDERERPPALAVEGVQQQAQNHSARIYRAVRTSAGSLLNNGITESDTDGNEYTTVTDLNGEGDVLNNGILNVQKQRSNERLLRQISTQRIYELQPSVLKMRISPHQSVVTNGLFIFVFAKECYNLLSHVIPLHNAPHPLCIRFAEHALSLRMLPQNPSPTVRTIDLLGRSIGTAAQQSAGGERQHRISVSANTGNLSAPSSTTAALRSTTALTGIRTGPRTVTVVPVLNRCAAAATTTANNHNCSKTNINN